MLTEIPETTTSTPAATAAAGGRKLISGPTNLSHISHMGPGKFHHPYLPYGSKRNLHNALLALKRYRVMVLSYFSNYRKDFHGFVVC